MARVAREGGLPPERMRAEETPAEDVVAACEALSLAGLRLVIVEGADAWKAPDAAAALAYLDRPNPGTCLALVATAAPTPKLMAAVAAAGAVLRYGPDPKDKPAKRAQWFAEHLAKEVGARRRLDPPAVARRAVDRVIVDRPDARRGGITAMELSREAEKLAAYADGEPITAEMVEALVPRHPDAKTYELSDALGAGDAARAYDVLQDLATGDDPVAPIVVQVQLSNHFRSPRAGPGPRRRRLARGGDRGDRGERLPGPQARRAGPGDAAGGRPAGRGAPGGARARPARQRPARARPLTGRRGAPGPGDRGAGPARPGARRQAGAGRRKLDRAAGLLPWEMRASLLFLRAALLR